MKTLKIRREWFYHTLIFSLCYFISVPVFSQNKGGKGDGYDVGQYLGLLNGTSMSPLFQGGTSDGFGQNRRMDIFSNIDPNSPFKGGEGDGYAAETFIGFLTGTSITVMFGGGTDDGFSVNRTSELLQPQVPLPIDLLSFDAFPIDDKVQVKWVTKSELNHDFFTVERSQDGVHYETLFMVSGAGTSLETQHYETIDSAPYLGLSYYRLKSTDFDESYSYSAIEVVNIKVEEKADVLVYPNPIMGKNFTIQISDLSSNTFLEIELMDILGREVYRQIIHSSSDYIVQEIELQNELAKGTYLLKLRNGNKQRSKLIIVQ